MPIDLALRRRFYAEEIQAVSNLKSEGLVEAFARVERERFLPPGPWLVKGEADFGTPPHPTPDADPRHLYHNFSVAIDPARQLFNGAPSLVGVCIDALAVVPGAHALHVGCGLGYYTAVLAHCCGERGRVLGLEADEALASRAQINLSSLASVQLRHGDARAWPDEPFDAVLFSAGVTHLRTEWLDGLRPGGTLVVPLTYAFSPAAPIGKGFYIAITRKNGGAYAARLVTFVAIYSATGLREEAANKRLSESMRTNPMPAFTCVRRESHDPEASCWLHGEGWCLTIDTAPGSGPKGQAIIA
ncbi:MAG: protein-L-isoaspartate O-methyltransferase family protein [Bacteroidales bacterium]